MTLAPPQAAAGWYPDPLRRHQHRYWDGAAWTAHVANDGVAALDPLPRAVAHGANVGAGWVRSKEWAKWPAPVNAVRGESHYQPTFIKLAGPVKEGSQYYLPVDVVLVREPNNPYDSNAIKATVHGHILGHIAKEIAQELAPLADEIGSKEWTVAGVIVGGCTDAPTFGLHLWLDRHLTPAPGPD